MLGLVEVVALNGLENVVETFPVALGDEEGEIELFVGYTDSPATGNAVIVRDGVGEFVARTWDTGERRYDRARITRLDTLLAERPVPSCRLLKLDIEGAELLFFRGASAFLATHRPIIYGEFNPVWMRQFGHAFPDVGALAAPLGYRFYRHVPRRGFVPLPEPLEGVENILLLPEGVGL